MDLIDLFFKCFEETLKEERGKKSPQKESLHKECPKNKFGLKKIFVNEKKGVTVLIWEDGSKTKAKCMPEDTFDVYTGFCIAFTKHFFHKSLKEYVDKYKNCTE